MGAFREHFSFADNVHACFWMETGYTAPFIRELGRGLNGRAHVARVLKTTRLPVSPLSF